MYCTHTPNKTKNSANIRFKTPKSLAFDDNNLSIPLIVVNFFITFRKLN